MYSHLHKKRRVLQRLNTSIKPTELELEDFAAQLQPVDDSVHRQCISKEHSNAMSRATQV